MPRVSYIDGYQDWTSRLSRLGQPIAFAMFGLAILLAAWNLAATSADRGKISAQNRVMLSLEQLLSALRDIETGSRGYVLVGQDEYLSPYRSSQAGLDGIEAATRTVWTESGRNPDALQPLFAMIEQKRSLAANVVSVRMNDGFAAAQALISRGEGKVTMDGVRTSVATLQAEAGNEVERLEARDRTR